jgi:hypothetical protein
VVVAVIPRVALLLILAGLLYAWAVDTSEAQTATPATLATPSWIEGEHPTDARLDGFVAGALDAWRARGFSSCDGRIITARRAAAVVGEPVGVVATLDGCDAGDTRMWLEDGQSEAAECLVTEHEIGHLLGLTHEDAAAYPVMSPHPEWTDRCLRLLPPQQAAPPLPAHPEPMRVCVARYAGLSNARTERLWRQGRYGQAWRSYKRWRHRTGQTIRRPYEQSECWEEAGEHG